jgi:hypothetical protein
MTRHLAWILVLTGACTAGEASKPVASKPAAPIHIEATEALTDGAGRTTEVEISFTLLRDAGDVALQITPDDGMTISGATASFAYGAGEKGDVFSETVTVRPDSEGVFYLKVLASGTFDGRRMARAAAIPVRTHPEARRDLEPEGRIHMGDDGMRILERPLEEK